MTEGRRAGEPSPVTRLLEDWRQGREGALERLMPLVYDELRRLAREQLRSERSDHTLQPTALVHEAFVRLVGAGVDWKDRAHFLGVTTRPMRQVLVDHSRGRNAVKRGGDRLRVTLDEQLKGGRRHGHEALDVLDLDRALSSLSERDPREAQIVELTYFGGLTRPEVAEVLDLSPATVDRDLRHARAWLRQQLDPD